MTNILSNKLTLVGIAAAALVLGLIFLNNGTDSTAETTTANVESETNTAEAASTNTEGATEATGGVDVDLNDNTRATTETTETTEN